MMEKVKENIIKIVWLCGRYVDSGFWEVCGIYDTKEAAIGRCTKWEDFVAPFNLNEDEPEETVPMDGIFYPLAKGVD